MSNFEKVVEKLCNEQYCDIKIEFGSAKGCRCNCCTEWYVVVEDGIWDVKYEIRKEYFCELAQELEKISKELEEKDKK